MSVKFHIWTLIYIFARSLVTQKVSIKGLYSKYVVCEHVLCDIEITDGNYFAKVIRRTKLL